MHCHDNLLYENEFQTFDILSSCLIIINLLIIISECEQLIKQMLTVDPIKRITMEQIIKHKWTILAGEDVDFDALILENNRPSDVDPDLENLNEHIIAHMESIDLNREQIFKVIKHICFCPSTVYGHKCLSPTIVSIYILYNYTLHKTYFEVVTCEKLYHQIDNSEHSWPLCCSYILFIEIFCLHLFFPILKSGLKSETKYCDFRKISF